MAMTDLTREKCRACNADEPVISDEEMKELLPRIPDWRVEERDGIRRLVREFRFNSYSEAMTFTNRTAHIAEEMGHHPAMLTEWRSEEHTSELQSRENLVCRLLLE